MERLAKCPPTVTKRSAMQGYRQNMQLAVRRDIRLREVGALAGLLNAGSRHPKSPLSLIIPGTVQMEV